LAARTLGLELDVARTKGELAGSTPQERFADFIRQVRTASGMAALFTKYPVLARIVATTCEQAVQAARENLARFTVDRAAIVAELLAGVDPGPLVAIEAGSGDLHRGGRSVTVLRFAGGAAVVYKPRSLVLHTRFDEFVGWLNAALPWLRLQTVRSVVRDGYGWQEFVAYEPCAERAGIERFYRRQGAMAALLNALDGTDIHHENVIARGEQPLVVDVETLFHPDLRVGAVTGPDPAMSALLSSVYRTALLPMMLVGEHGALDISGVGGDRDRTYPVDVVGWDGAGTDRMRLVRRPFEFGGNVNRPRWRDRDVDPAQYAHALLTGFSAAYDAILRGRQELLGAAGPLARCAGVEMRILARTTRTYSMLLDESTHPDVLRDSIDRDRLFDVLRADAHDEHLLRLVPHEIADLWAGDVPIFLGRPDSRECWTSAGVALPDLLESTGLASVTAKIMRMGELDRQDQEWVIQATLASRAAPAGHGSGAALAGPVAAAVLDPERLLSAACAIADEIVARTLHNDDRANWLSMEQVDGRHWMVVPMGAGLATGYTGVALFLAQLGAVTGIGRYADLARKAVRTIPRLIDSLSADAERAEAIGCGGFLGMGGICYAVARLGTLLGDGDLVDLSARIVPIVDLADDGTETSLAIGRAGGLAAMLAVHAETGLASAGALAAQFARRLVEPAAPDHRHAGVVGDSWPTGGFLWGPTGIGWALLRYATTAGRGGGEGGERYADHGRTALAPDFDADGPDHGWCSGMSGWLLARGSVGSSTEIDRHVGVLAERPPLQDTSLCHGELGIVESLAVLGANGDARAAAIAERRAAVLLGGLNHFGPRCGTPGGTSCPGLFTGLAGIGYGLMRLGLADQVPSVLLLEPSAARAAHIHQEDTHARGVDR
jgi:type 2 lantibiotic biosynthesis protein LanM